MALDFAIKHIVIAYVKTLGPGHTVFKDPEQTKYNVCLTEKTYLYKPEWVVLQT